MIGQDIQLHTWRISLPAVWTQKRKCMGRNVNMRTLVHGFLLRCTDACTGTWRCVHLSAWLSTLMHICLHRNVKMRIWVHGFLLQCTDACIENKDVCFSAWLSAKMLAKEHEYACLCAVCMDFCSNAKVLAQECEDVYNSAWLSSLMHRCLHRYTHKHVHTYAH